MLILGTLIVTWIVRNWWKILLLLIAVIILREYQVHKHRNEPKAIEGPPGKDPADPLYIPPPFSKEKKDNNEKTGSSIDQ